MSHQPYPPFDLQCGQDIWRILRNGLIRDEFRLFAKCTYTLVGAGLGMTIGEPDDVEPLSFGGEECDVETAAKVREELIAIGDVGLPENFGAGEGEKAIDPALVMLLVQLAVKAIEKWLERRRGGS